MLKKVCVTAVSFALYAASCLGQTNSNDGLSQLCEVYRHATITCGPSLRVYFTFLVIPRNRPELICGCLLYSCENSMSFTTSFTLITYTAG